ncbi:MAG: IPT/TIG domain-containing protein [Ktedonobacteraceae bacterium]|nr:IPT/TIG domain-containing protein [Ktedonobacteraceae bacterium]
MQKLLWKYALFLFFSITGLLAFPLLFLPAQPVHAAALAGPAAVDISLPDKNLPVVGHPGTKVIISGQGFAASSAITLYLTADPDAQKCTAAQAANMTQFGQVTAKADGTFTQTTTWPASAGNATTAYYICAIAAADNVTAFSQKPFTVAQQLSIDSITPQTVTPGSMVTITGSNWMPAQPLKVSIFASDGKTAIAYTSNVQPQVNDGSFSTQLQIPADTLPGTYTVQVTAIKEPTMTLSKSGLVVQSAAATATPSTAQPSPTSAPQATATTAPGTASNGANSGGGGIITPLVFVLGGVGIVLVIIGLTTFIIYSRKG